MTIDKTKWILIKALVAQAREVEPASRQRFVADACGHDDALRREVESILSSMDDAPDLFARSVPELSAPFSAVPCDLTGRNVGSYRLTGLIARGGMGAVYKAERADGAFAQTVAIKLIEHPLLTEESTRRFGIERQALALLHHSNIAQLHDGGVTDDGLPYLVMDYIDGVPIDVYCDGNRLTIEQRLKLFQQVCAAIQHAHGHLVVHRDIKPGNVLATSDGVIKLVDFGIAHLLGGAPDSRRTITSHRMLTPMYASPEQMRGEHVTTASDIYALGVLLYELLTGRRPYVFDGASSAQIERTVCDTNPPRPSTIVNWASTDDMDDHDVSAIARLRSTRPEGLTRRLRGDLDVTVLRAMHKEPGRRYDSVEQFSEDLRRHLVGLPIRAREESMTYRFGKFAHRHALSLAAAAAVTLALIAGLTAAVWQAQIATSERDAAVAARHQAHAEARKAERINDFLQSILAAAQPALSGGEEVTVRQVIERAANRIDRELSGEPQVAASAHLTVGQTYASLGLYEKARKHLDEAMAIRRRECGAQHPDTAECLQALATLDFSEGRYKSGEQRVRQALAVYRQEYGEDHETVAQCHNDLGALLRAQADNDQAEQHLLRALEIRQQRLGEHHPAVAETLNNLAALAVATDNLERAESLCREVLTIREATLGSQHPDTAQAHNNLAVALAHRGKYDDASVQLANALVIYRNLLSPDHPTLLSTMGNLSGVLVTCEQFDRAEPLLQEVLTLQEQTLSSDHPSMATTLWNLAACKLGQDQHSVAEQFLRRCLHIRQRRLSDDDPRIAITLGELGRCLYDQQRFADAKPYLLKSLQAYERIHGADHATTSDAREWMVRVDEALLEPGSQPPVAP